MIRRKGPGESAAKRRSLGPAKKTKAHSRQVTSDKQPMMAVTPAGPIRKDRLSFVPPGKRIRRTPQGEYLIEDAAPSDNEAPPPSTTENKDD